jgi:hypothetical protein
LPQAGAADSGVGREEEQIQKKIEEEVERRSKEMEAKLDKEAAETKWVPGADSPHSSPLVFIAEPNCAPIGRQWLVSGKAFNSGDKAVRSRKVTITLLIDGEPAEEQTVVVGPFKPLGIQSYEALFRPSRNTYGHTVTAHASWER